MAITPPPRNTARTPPTPLHGAKHDSYQPYSVHKNTRLSSQKSQRVTHTPPPRSSEPSSPVAPASTSKGPSQIRQAATHTISPPSSPQTSPQKKIFKTERSGKSLRSGAMGGSDAANPLLQETFEESDSISALHLSATNNGAGMLPTPAKTPRKKPIPALAIASTARVLFPVRPDPEEDIMPTPRRRGRKTRRHVGFSLDDSMENDDTEGKIQIYTDSKEKVPELDPSEDNPFYNTGGPTVSKEPLKVKRGKKGKTTGLTSESKEQIEKAFNREEGMVYVFRGKKIYRKFADESFPEEADMDLDPSVPPRLRPFTRSSIKPRLLFPAAGQRRELTPTNDTNLDEDENEAVTDVESAHLPPGNDSEITDLAPDTEEEPLTATPVKPSFGIDTPPTTARKPSSTTATATSRQARIGSSSPPAAQPEPEPGPLDPSESASQVLARRHGKKTSPFATWRRTKATVSIPAAAPAAPAKGKEKGRKRPADQLDGAADGDAALGKKVKAN